VTNILEEQYGHFSQLAREVADMHQRYEARKRSSNAMDFDDLSVLWLRLLQDHQDVREQYQRRFQFILVTSTRIRTSSKAT
jgi:superfamily I DNA/RNA helicase